MTIDSFFIIVALGAAVAGFVQGLSGFAFGLVAMSFWAWTVDPRLAVSMSVVGALSGQVVAAVTVRRGFDWRLLLPFVLGGLAGLPIGVLLLPLLDANLFKMMLGLVLAILCPVMLFAKHLPRVTWGGGIADGASGFIGGVLGGIGGFTGPVPTLWCTMRRIDKDSQRSVIQNYNLSMLSATLAAYVATGVITKPMLPAFAIVVPAMLIPTLIGTRVYIGISEAAFRVIVLGCLTASGIAMLASSLPHLIGTGV